VSAEKTSRTPGRSPLFSLEKQEPREARRLAALDVRELYETSVESGGRY